MTDRPTTQALIDQAVTRELITYLYATKPEATTYHVFLERLSSGDTREHKMETRSFRFYLLDLLKNARS